MIASSIFFVAAAAGALELPAFLTGCWEHADGPRWTQECWMEPRGGIMLGASREGDGEKLISWEQTMIRRSASGKITLFASPGGRTPVPFEARHQTPTSIEFVNARHDYPQRIRYEIKDRRLEAEISLIDGSRALRWTYRRESN